MSKSPELSVVLATYNRADTLEQTIQHLIDQSIPPETYEVLVVDDGSEDSTREVVERARQRARFHLQYLCHPNRGPGYSQNRGILAARGEIVVLIADDIFLTPGALRAHLDCHRRWPEGEVAVLGRVLQSPSLKQSTFLNVWNPFSMDRFPDGAELPYYMFWACNISFKRGFMKCYGMFRDEMGRAGAAAHEDVELGYRLHLHGLRVIFSESALGFHHHVVTLRGMLDRSYERGLNWHDFRALVPGPEIDIRYRVFNLPKLVRLFRALAGDREKYLMGYDRSFLHLLLRYVIRMVVFNSLTVNLLWLPLFDRAEHDEFLGKHMADPLYRGVVLYYFLKGCREGERALAGPGAQTQPCPRCKRR
jgi:glycosyltransferase involved in cell wall biosynthesis